jgi:hypothetical protein
MQYFNGTSLDLISKFIYGVLILFTSWNSEVQSANVTTYYSVKGISTWNRETENGGFCKQAAFANANMTYQSRVNSVPTRHLGKGQSGFCQSLPTVKEDFILQVLTPPQTGLTFSAQPTLYWFVSKPITAHFIFYLTKTESNSINDYKHNSLLNKTLFISISKPGIQSFSLNQYPVSLEKNIEYKWSITLVCDSQNASTSPIFTEGRIKYVKPAFDIGQPDFALYAQHGFWYDALDTVSELISNHSTNKELRQARALLLQQGELLEVLAYN